MSGRTGVNLSLCSSSASQLQDPACASLHSSNGTAEMATEGS